MDDLIEALTILRKYGNPDNPTHCELAICGIKPLDVSSEDRGKLRELGFILSLDEDEDHDKEDGEEAYFCSFKFGSA